MGPLFWRAFFLEFMEEFIEIKGARANNLKNVDLKIPLGKLVCFKGVSGSGKTSLAFETLYNESKRRFLNSLPTKLQFFSERPAPADVDLIYPVLPVFGLPQNNPIVGTRSNIIDTMGITEQLQKISYLYGKLKCSVHKKEFIEVSAIENELSGYEAKTICHFFVKREVFIERLRDTPFPTRSIKSVRSKSINDFNEADELWELTRLRVGQNEKIHNFIQKYKDVVREVYLYSEASKKIIKLPLSVKNICPESGCDEEAQSFTIDRLSPLNSLGACENCQGFGEVLEYDINKMLDKDKSIEEGGIKFFEFKKLNSARDILKKELKGKYSFKKSIRELGKDFEKDFVDGIGKYKGVFHYQKLLEKKRYKTNIRVYIRKMQTPYKCESCNASRLGLLANQTNILNTDTSLSKLVTLSVGELNDYFKENFQSIKLKELSKIKKVLKCAVDIGLGHLSLTRKVKTVSAGEYQRLLLLKFLAFEGTNSLFVLDEPSLGLGLNEQKAVYKGLQDLISQGNSIVTIEHSSYFQSVADHIVEFGPASGQKGGTIVYEGPYKKDKKTKTSKLKTTEPGATVDIIAPEVYGQKFSDLSFFSKTLTLIYGPSGSGKTATLFNTLANELNYKLNGEYLDPVKGKFKKINGLENFKDVIVVNANLNRYSSRSTVGSITELNTPFKKSFTKLPISKSLDLKDGHFSKNSQLGQCPDCDGKGLKIIEMQFLEDLLLKCEDCNGTGLKKKYSTINNGVYTVSEGYDLPIVEAFSQIQLTPKFQRIVRGMEQLNLDYLSLGREVNTLSGGEKQRLYLLSKTLKKLSDTLIIIENISFDLSEADLANVIRYLEQLNLAGNTILLLDQNEQLKKIIPNQVKYLKLQK